MTEQMPAPASYATADQARAYVAGVLSRPAPAVPPRVYLIVRPKLFADKERWAKIGPALRAKLPGAELVTYRDLFGRQQRPAAERVEGIEAECAGAVVVPFVSRWPDLPVRYLIGYAGRLEADELCAAGVPVLVFTPRGMAAWPDVLVQPAGEPLPPPHLSQELFLPELPDRPLPTVAASYRAMGLSLPAPRKPRRSTSASASARPVVPAARMLAAAGR